MAIDDLKNYPWEVDYRSSDLKDNGQPVDILHDFYIPALSRIKYYDRVAGYFRSTSLAAASQGYTAFLEHGGKMRLIVGADLQLADVAAILQGNKQRLSDRLMAELDHEENWPQEVKNGVALLAQMVAEGKLEVKVAVRVSSVTHQPLSVDSTEDGYVHEKWFVMQDESGNRMSGDGSLNESRTALQLNAENISLNFEWDGGNDARRVAKAARNFALLWENKNPSLKIVCMPEAVKERLVKLKSLSNKPTEVDGTVIKLKPTFSPMDILRFSVLKDAPKMPNGIYVGMYSAPVAPWPHQEIVARRLIESYPYSYMMCDEVGLGKTIEAALAIRSLVLSGRVSRVLIVPPAGLGGQWHRELASKAMLPFAKSKSKPGASGKANSEWIYPFVHSTINDNIFAPNLNIVSQGLMSRKERMEQFVAADDYDIVLVDEAHYARRSNPRAHSVGAAKYGKLYQNLNKTVNKQSKTMWLATATPMQIDSIEAYDLLRLTNRVGAFGNDPTLCLEYFALIGDILAEKKINAQEWRLLGQNFHHIQAEDPYLQQRLEKTVVSGKNRNALKELPYTIAAPKNRDIPDLIQPLFAASPLSRVMMRHTRALLEIYKYNGELRSNLAQRIVLPICVIEFTLEEQNFYDSLEVYCDELKAQIDIHNEQNSQVMTFLLNFLQLRFASSMDAIRLTLERRLKKVRNTLLLGNANVSNQAELEVKLKELMEEDNDYNEDDLGEISFDTILKQRSSKDLKWEQEQLEQMLIQLGNMAQTPSKILRLLQEIDRRKHGERVEQLVIFTRFKDTLDSIRKHLKIREPRLRVGIYAGQEASYFDVSLGKDKNASHEEIKNLFLAGEIDILLCTDAAAEGLNLQTANMLINFDLGWNPMKIEQRIGRIDRIGQKHNTIYVLNMCYLGSTEEVVYGRLCARLREANLVVGNQQISMLPVGPTDFQGLQNGTLTLEELEFKAKKQLTEQKKRLQSMEMSAEDIYNMYKKLSQEHSSENYPAELEDIWDAIIQSDYFRQLDCHVDEEGILCLQSQSQIQHFTKDRDKIKENVSLLTWGNPFVDRLFSIIEENAQACPWLRLVWAEKYGVSIYGYAVSTDNGCQLITSYSQLQNIELDTSGIITANDVENCQKKLEKLCRADFSLAYKLAQSISINELVSKSHQKLVKYSTLALLDIFQNKKHLETYYDVVRNMEDESVRRYPVELPFEEFVNITEEELLFNINKAGNRVYFNIEGMFISIVYELIQRVADSMKEKRSNITIDMLRHRISSWQ